MRVIFIALLALPCLGSAQEKTVIKPTPYEKAPFNVRWAPLTALNFSQQTIALQADIPFSAHWVFDLGVGWIFNGPTANQTGEVYTGIRLKPAIKYYFREDTRRGWRPTISLGPTYSYAYNDRYIEVLRQGGQYQETLLSRRYVVSTGALFRYNLVKYFGKNDHWMTEWYFGLGPRWTRIRNADLPPDAEVLTPRSFLFNLEREPGVHYVPEVMIGIAIGRTLGN